MHFYSGKQETYAPAYPHLPGTNVGFKPRVVYATGRSKAMAMALFLFRVDFAIGRVMFSLALLFVFVFFFFLVLFGTVL